MMKAELDIKGAPEWGDGREGMHGREGAPEWGYGREVESNDKSTEDQDIEESDANEQEMFEHYRYVVDPGQAPVRIDKYLTGQMEYTSRNRIQLAIKAEFVRVADKTVKANYIVRPGDVITFVMPYQRRGTEIKPQNIPLNIAYEDDDLMVVNKPAGMVVHPGHGHYEGTLVNALAWHLGLREDVKDGDGRMGMLVHRIDKDTSGLLVISKSDEAQMGLSKQFFVHSIERRYIAVVWGNIEEDEGTVDSNIGRDPSDRLKFKALDNREEGKTAITHYKVLERMGFITVVECRLETGRTHQIRVHMSSIGHPLFGDERYGGTTINKGTIYAKYRQFIENCFKICPRQALHAASLGFEHPLSRKHLLFEAPLPADMATLIAKWRDYARLRPSEE